MVTLVIAEALFRLHPDEDEGILSARRAAIVSARRPGRIGPPDRPRRRPSCSARAKSRRDGRTPGLAPGLGLRGARRGDLSRPRLRRRPGLGPRAGAARARASDAPLAEPEEREEPAPGAHPADERRAARTTGSSRRPVPTTRRSSGSRSSVSGRVLGAARAARRRSAEIQAAEAALPVLRALVDAPDDEGAPTKAPSRRARRDAPARLLALRLQGFKSFAERTVVEFGPGISAVVGPNGSGKSNLADALRWTLGEQGRALRSRKGEDVIFAGSERRAALGMADVTLVLDNARRAAAGRVQRPRAGSTALPVGRERLPPQQAAGPAARPRRPARLGPPRRQRLPVHRPGDGRPGPRAPTRGAPAAVRGGGRRPPPRAPPAQGRGAARRGRGATSPGSTTSWPSSGRRPAGWRPRPSSR